MGFKVGRELKEETSKCSFQFLGRKDSAKPGLAISVQGCEKIKFLQSCMSFKVSLMLCLNRLYENVYTVCTKMKG